MNSNKTYFFILTFLFFFSFEIYAVTLSVYAFIGTGVSSKDIDLPEKMHSLLLKTGHVGISFDRGTTIYGFGPILPSGYDTKRLLEELRQLRPFHGQVTDDTEIFKIVAQKKIPSGQPWKQIKFGKNLKNLQVYAIDLEVSEDVFKRFRADVLVSSNGGLRKMYAFPNLGSHLPYILNNTYNCSTYPVSLGIDNWPDKSGFTIKFVEEMAKVANFRELNIFPEAILPGSILRSIPNYTKPFSRLNSPNCSDLLKSFVGN